MLSREQAISKLHEYKVPFDEADWQRPSSRTPGEFGIFAIIIRVIAGFFIFGMVLTSIAGFIALTGLDGSWEHVAGFIGVVATLFAGWKFRTSYRTLEKQYDFSGLLFLSILLVGKACLLAALYGWFGMNLSGGPFGLTIALIFALITLASCFFYRMYLEAFLAVLVAAFLLNSAIGSELMKVLVDMYVPKEARFNADSFPEGMLFSWYAVQTVMVALPILLVVMLTWVQKQRYLSSVYSYALLALIGYLLFPSDKLFLMLMSAPNVAFGANWGVSLLTFIATAMLYLHLLPDATDLSRKTHLPVLLVVAILALFGMHGVLFALALMAWGHVRHDRVLWVTGLLYLPAYLIAYYYALDMTLLMKSYVLLGSGAVVLLARYVLKRFFMGGQKEQANA